MLLPYKPTLPLAFRGSCRLQTTSITWNTITVEVMLKPTNQTGESALANAFIARWVRYSPIDERRAWQCCREACSYPGWGGKRLAASSPREQVWQAPGDSSVRQTDEFLVARNLGEIAPAASVENRGEVSAQPLNRAVLHRFFKDKDMRVWWQHESTEDESEFQAVGVGTLLRLRPEDRQHAAFTADQRVGLDRQRMI